MEIHKKVGIITSLFAGTVLATSVSAATVDFTSGAPWNSGGNSISDGTVTVESVGGTITWENDGLGVSSGEPDEVDNSESLLISFANAVDITSIWLDDFWNTTSSGTPEQAFVTVNGSETFTLDAFLPNTAGPNPSVFNFASLSSVSTLLFQAIDPGVVSSDGDDFALARIDFEQAAPVPVPAAFWLLGSAMVFLFRKRQTS